MKKTIDTYIAGFPPGTRTLLKQLRATIKRTAPVVTERISYGIPTFDLDGKRFMYFAGWKNHVSIYPVTRGIERALKREIDPYRAGKGTLRFPLGVPLPMPLIRKIVATRATELRGS